MKAKEQIKNFVLNIALWQVENSGFCHKVSLHIQGVVPNFVITKMCVDNGKLSFDGMKYDTEKSYWVDGKNISASELTEEQLDKVLSIIKKIDLFK